jgi:hypothetical protein
VSFKLDVKAAPKEKISTFNANPSKKNTKSKSDHQKSSSSE